MFFYHRFVCAWLWKGVVAIFLVGSAVWITLHVLASPVTIGLVNTNNNSNNVTGAQTVFISSEVGYTFFRDRSPNLGRCVYRKTTDGGQTWGSPVRVDGQSDCVKIVVWYDQWTPGGTGDYIHIVTMDTGDNSLWYNRLDTTTDVRLMGENPVNITSNAGYSGGLTEAANTHSLTVATDGTIYAAVSDNSDAIIVSCSSSCHLATSWNEVGSSGTLPNATDHNLLMPLSGGDILLINRSIVSGILRSRIWNGSSWGSWTTIDSFVDNQPLFPGGMAAVPHPTSSAIYLAYAADHNDYTTADHDIRTRRFNGSTWSSGADVLTNASGRGLHNVDIALDADSGDVYVLYVMRDTIGTNTSAHVYWKQSTDSMTSWGTEQGPVSASSGNYYGPFTNLLSADRIHTAWFDPGTNTRFGATVVDLAPDVVVETLGSPSAQERAGFAGHLGGAFVISARNSNTISSITLTEVGSIAAAVDISNVVLYYDLDTTAPYDCTSESFTGSEAQFGATSTAGFASATSSITFTNAPITVSNTQTMCVYVVMAIATTTPDGVTLQLAIENPESDIGATTIAAPNTSVQLSTTTIVSPNLTQTRYHWRNDDGTEVDATSATAGVENTPLADVPKGQTRRLRLQVANEGSTTSAPTVLQLEYALAVPTCAAATGWEMVTSTSTDWQLTNSSFLTDGADTTNITSAAAGALTDPHSNFITPNAGVRDATNPVSALTFATTSFVEVEFAVQAQPVASDGDTYCFRLSAAGEPLFAYSAFAEATIAADVFVSASGAALATAVIPSTDVWFGGVFAITEQAASRTVESITISHTGTTIASSSLANVRLQYTFDTTAPYTCVGESYISTHPQFGGTAASGFATATGSITFTDAVAISTTSTLCVFVVADITTNANNADTVRFTITDPTSDVGVSSGSVAPSTPVAPTGVTELLGGEIVQTGYHWRVDDGSETGASSATGGNENSLLAEMRPNQTVRLRLGVANTGATTSVSQTFRLEYGVRVTTCDLVSHWVAVDAASDDAWNMGTSSFVSHGNDTTNISVGSGGVTDGNSTFITTNNGIRSLTATTEPIALTNDQFTEYEFVLRSSLNTAFDTTYCFRLTNLGTPLTDYLHYPQLTTAPKRDFKVQRGTTVISTSTATIIAGIDYEAPLSSNAAFIRITNVHHTGAGNTTGGGTQNPTTVTVFIQNPDNLGSSITFNRAAATGDNTYIDWEIVEFVGVAGTDNEMIVRSVGTVTLAGNQTTISGGIISVDDDASVVVYITGIKNSITTQNYFASQVTSNWSAADERPVFTREVAASVGVELSYAVVEYTGVNWRVQRVAHTYTDAGVTESASITPVGSLSRTFIHAQKRLGASDTVASLGQTVWLSSIGSLSLQLDVDADMTVTHRAVVWIVENTQIGNGAMTVQRLNGTTSGGSQPLTLSLTLPTTLPTLTNASVFASARAAVANTSHPRAHAGVKLASTTAVQIWRSNTGSALTYRLEVVSWPIADLALRQVQYRFFVDNNQITPIDPWPPGAADVGENTSITRFDEPLGDGEVVRVRVGIRASNANMPVDFTGFILEYAERVTTCAAVASWTPLGDGMSNEIWRGFVATGTTDGVALSVNPPTVGDLLLSTSDVAGRLVHENPAASNPYPVAEGQVLEYDWYIQQNGAEPSTTYCFRVVRDDDVPLREYVVYPQIRTASFLPVSRGWRWYSDPENETPTVALSSENVAPINIGVGDTLTLRIAVQETKAIAGPDARFILQFSDDALFTSPIDMTATSSCAGNSLWCFYQGGGVDNTTITTALLTDSDSCVAGSGDGCGTHHVSTELLPGHTHVAGAVQEYSFTIVHDGARVNRVYYFRLFDTINQEPVPPAVGSSYPSVATESSSLTLAVDGLPIGTTTAGVTITATATAQTISFGPVFPSLVDIVAGQRLSISTNATQGYQVLTFARQPLTNELGIEIPAISGTNANPVSWSVGCTATSTACVGYHTTDAVLAGGSTRFGASDTYAGLHQTMEEIAFSSLPTTEQHDIIYRLQITPLQPPGVYETGIVYIAVPVH